MLERRESIRIAKPHRRQPTMPVKLDEDAVNFAVKKKLFCLHFNLTAYSANIAFGPR
ncbi:MAG: hypothetical protein LIP23_00580 [Planctomycetes bacterium]|nr:hypothetical protein [Planctomycetota bacterium]